MTQPITELLIKPITQNGSPGDSLLITPESVGFQYLTFRVRRLIKGERFSSQTDINELGMVVLGGRCSVESSAGSWSSFGGRAHVFDGLPYALYLPIQTSFTVIAETDCEIAFCLCRAEEQYPAHLVTPEQVEVEIRGGANATRQINHILKPEFPAQRLLMVEVYTPGGNWSSYPPHKHDVHNPPAEVDLDEIYYYRMNRPGAFAHQRLYSSDGQRDSVVTVHNGDAVLVHEGYHPVVAGPGYDTYYLNFIAGSARSLAITEDPIHTWIRSSWKDVDPRLPVVR